MLWPSGVIIQIEDTDHFLTILFKVLGQNVITQMKPYFNSMFLTWHSKGSFKKML